MSDYPPGSLPPLPSIVKIEDPPTGHQPTSDMSRAGLSSFTATTTVTLADNCRAIGPLIQDNEAKTHACSEVQSQRALVPTSRHDFLIDQMANMMGPGSDMADYTGPSVPILDRRLAEL